MVISLKTLLLKKLQKKCRFCRFSESKTFEDMQIIHISKIYLSGDRK